jgi:hypothetical protein
MSQKPDDLAAIKTICDALEPFDENERERIIRWASERLGLRNVSSFRSVDQSIPPASNPHLHDLKPSFGAKDIKTFLDEKNPTSANQLVAAVAYYLKFEAPASERKNSITADDIMEACRKGNRERPKHANQILVNASGFGLVDKVGTGTYEINAVGENLVAVSMPTASHGNAGPKRSSSPAKKNATKKPSLKKSTNKK